MDDAGSAYIGQRATPLALQLVPTDDVDDAALLALAKLCPEGMGILEGPSALESRIAWANPALRRLLEDVTPDPEGMSIVDLMGIESSGENEGARTVASALIEAARWGDALVPAGEGQAVAAQVRPSVRKGRGPDRWVLLVTETMSTPVADEALRASEERFRALATNAPIGVFFSEVGLRLGYVNDRFAELWGATRESILGMGWLEGVESSDTVQLVDALSSVLAGEPFDLVVRVRRGTDSEIRWARTRAAPVRLPGHGAGFVGSVEDVTDARRHEELLARQATHDPLTGLPNRTLLWQRLHELLDRPPHGATPQLHSVGAAPAAPPADGGRRSRPPKAPGAALLFFDLDDFKLVNDTLGHQAGDALLISVAERLKEGVRPEDMVVRLGGDEFVVLCQVTTGDEATVIAERLAQSIRQPVVIDGTEILISASVGVVVADQRHDAESLLRDADVAMYQAKQAGKARFAVFDERVRTGMQERLGLVVDLRRAVENRDLGVVYQPIWDVSGELPVLVAVEALVRWDHPTRGPVAPDQIIALAEEHGLIDELGAVVLQRSCADLATWRAALGGAAPGYVSVNLCTAQLRKGGLPELVAGTLGEYGLTGRDLCLELTETVVMDDIDGALLILDALRDLGVSLAVDDFGTGYSSLAYLQRLPVQVVKIDRSFVGNLGEDPDRPDRDRHRGDTAIVAAVVAMAEAFGLRAVAEGVERPEQLALLRGLGCDLAQGYLLAKPMPAADLAEVLRHPPQLALTTTGDRIPARRHP